MFTGLITAAVICGLIIITGGVALFMFLPILLASLGIIALIAAMLAVCVLLLPSLITLDDLKPQILDIVQKKIEREVTIGGKIGFSVWPVLGLEIHDISIGNPNWATDPIMLSADELVAGVTLSSLLDGKLELREIRLVKPQLNLLEDAKGRQNWVFTHANTAKAEPVKQEEAKALSLKDIAIEKIRLVDGAVNLDSPKMQSLEIKKINVSFSMAGLDHRAALQGSMVVKDDLLSIDSSLDTPRAMMEGTATPARIAVNYGGDKIDLDGKLTGTQFDGAFDVAVANVPKLLAQISGQKPAALPVTSINMDATLSANPTNVKMEGMSLRLDSLLLSGSAGLALGGSKPAISADLETASLNLDKLMPAAAPQAGEATTAQTSEKATPINLAPLNSVNADIKLATKQLIAKGLELGNVQLNTTLNGGRLLTKISAADFYSGALKASADLSAASRALKADVSLSNVEIEPILVALSGASKLTGKGDFSTVINTQLRDSNVAVASLNGTGKFAFRDGALKGVNIAALVRNAKNLVTGQKSTVGIGSSEQTDFTALTGSYSIASGMVKNDDLQLLSPLVRVGGKGSVNLPQKLVDYRIETALVADLTGQGGTMDKKGIVIPILVKGPFSNLSYLPDVQGLILGNIGANPAGALKDIGAAVQGVRGKDVLNNIVSGIAKPANNNTPDAAQPAAPNSVLDTGKAIQNLFGK